MRICGIDSSTTATSISLFVNGQFQDYSLIVGDKKKYPTKWDRIDPMLKNIGEVLDKYNPDIVYQENSYKGNNVDNLKALTNILGGVRFWCVERDKEYHQLMPAQWRAVLKLNKYEAERPELKNIAMEFVREKYGIEVPTDDVSDAICIGLCGLILKGENGYEG